LVIIPNDNGQAAERKPIEAEAVDVNLGEYAVAHPLGEHAFAFRLFVLSVRLFRGQKEPYGSDAHWQNPPAEVRLKPAANSQGRGR
jgi:hypothetical protein